VNRSWDKALVETGDSLVGEYSLQSRDSASNHSVLFLTDNQHAGNFEWVRNKHGSKCKTCIHWYPVVSKGPWQESSHHNGVSAEGCAISESEELGDVGTPVRENGAVFCRLSGSGRVDDLAMSHESVQRVRESGVGQKSQSSHVEVEATKHILNNTHACERHSSSEQTIAELATLLEGHKLSEEVLAALLVEVCVEDSVGLRDVEGVAQVVVHFLN